MYGEWIDAIQGCRLFEGIEKRSLELMLDCLKPGVRICRPREVIVTRGEPFRGVGVIARGKVSLIKDTYGGNSVMIGMLAAGDTLGETVAFSDRQVWPSTVIAQSDCIVLFLSADKITGTCSNVCLSHATLILNMLRVLTGRAAMLDRKIEHLAHRSVRGKISSYLLDLYREGPTPSLTVPMKRHELADYLNVPRPSLSREMGLMRDDGLIEFSGHLVTVKDVLGLERQAY